MSLKAVILVKPKYNDFTLDALRRANLIFNQEGYSVGDTVKTKEGYFVYFQEEETMTFGCGEREIREWFVRNGFDKVILPPDFSPSPYRRVSGVIQLN